MIRLLYFAGGVEEPGMDSDCDTDSVHRWESILPLLDHDAVVDHL